MKTHLYLILFFLSSVSWASGLKNPPEKLVDWVEFVESNSESYFVRFHSQARLFNINKKDKDSVKKIKQLQQAQLDNSPLGFEIDPKTQQILEIYSP